MVIFVIIGYLLFDDGGILLLEKQFVEVLTHEKTSLFASLLTAITRVMEEILHQHPRHLELENTHLYFGYRPPFIFVLIVDSENEIYEKLADTIARDLAEADLNPEEMHVSDIARQAAKRIIDHHIAKTPLLVVDLKALANIIKTTSEFIRNRIRSGFPVRKPKTIEIKPTKVKPTKPKLKSFENLIELYFDGKLSDVVKYAPGFFDGDYADLARILYAKAGLILRLYDPKVWAPPLEQLYGVSTEISDEIAKRVLIAETEMFARLPSETPFSIYLRHSDEISVVLQGEDLRATVYEILFNPIPIAPFLNMIIRKYENRSRYMFCLAKENLMLLKMLRQKPRNVDEWLLAFSETKTAFEKSLKERDHLLDHHYHVLLSTLIWGMLTPDITVEDGFKLIDHFVSDIKKYQKELEERSERIMITHKAWNIIWVYNVLMRVLLEATPPEERRNLLDELQRRVLDSAKYFSDLLERRRIPIYLYYVTLISLISLYTRIGVEHNTVPDDIIEILPEFVPSDIQNLFEIAPQSFYQYYLCFLETLGNIALFIDLHVVRTNLLMKIAHLLEKVADAMSDVPIYKFLAKLFAFRFYMLVDSKEARNAANRLLSEAEKEFSPFLIHIFKRLYEFHSKSTQEEL